jgi:DNA-binding NarL/FixJ family response regulator
MAQLGIAGQFAGDTLELAFELGARGYVLKTDAISELPTAIKTVMSGDTFVSSGCRQLDSPKVSNHTAAVDTAPTVNASFQ